MQIERVATHEAGHAVAALAVGLDLVLATIDPAVAPEDMAGLVRLADRSSSSPLHELSAFALHNIVSTAPILDSEIIRAATYCYARTVVTVAATSAERLFYPEHEPMEAGGDDDAAIDVANRMSNRPVHFLWCARRDAKRIVKSNRHQIEILAEALLEYQTLSGAEIEAVLSGRFNRRKQQWAATIASANLFEISHGGLQRLGIA